MEDVAAQGLRPAGLAHYRTYGPRYATDRGSCYAPDQPLNPRDGGPSADGRRGDRQLALLTTQQRRGDTSMPMDIEAPRPWRLQPE